MFTNLQNHWHIWHCVHFSYFDKLAELPPMGCNLSASGKPNAFVTCSIFNKASNCRRPAWPPCKTTMKADIHHFRRT